MQFQSSRKIPLICQTVGAVPIITMENWPKWYGVEILHPDGKVEDVDPDLLDELCGNLGLMGDHNYHPKLLEMVANNLGGVVDQVSLCVAAGRWKVEIDDERNDYSYSTLKLASVANGTDENNVSDFVAALTLLRLKWVSKHLPDYLPVVRILYRPDGTLVLNDLTATIPDLDKLDVPTSSLELLVGNYLPAVV